MTEMSEPLTAEPTFDADGYPTEETLQRIEAWTIETFRDFEAVMDFVGRAWRYEAWTKESQWKGEGELFPKLRYVFSTYGWSGNESLVTALESNTMVQAIGAWSWRRGGHYEYRFPEETTG